MKISLYTSLRTSCVYLVSVVMVINVAFSQPLETRIARTPLVKYFEPAVYNGGIQNWSFAQDSSKILYVANNFGLLEFDGSNWTNYAVPNSTKIRSVHVDKSNRIFIGGQGQIGYFVTNKNGLVFTSLLEILPPEKQAIAEVWKIIELDGTIYFNTSNKLLAFKGQDFYEIDLIGSLQLAFNVDSKLIVQFLDKGLFELSNDTFTPIEATKNLDEEIISILPDGDGFLCFATSGNIYRYANQILSEVTSNLPEDLKSATINTAIRLSTGEIAIGTQSEGLFILDDNLNLKSHLTKNKGLNNRTVLALFEDNFKNLWVGLNNGINYVELSSPLSLIDEEVGLEGTGYTAKIHNNKVFLGTSNGLFSQNLIGSNQIRREYALIPESEGQVYNLSVVDNDLILNHHRGAFQVLDNDLIQFHDVGSWKLTETSIPGLALGGNYEGICFFEKISGKWHLSRTVPGLLESSRVFEFANDSALWMTHGYKGAYLIEFDKELEETKQITFYGKQNGLPSNLLISVYQLNESLVFTSEEGIYSFNGDSLFFNENSFLNEKIGTNHVSEISENPVNGDIFFLSNRELGYLKRESFGSYKKEQNVFKRINKLINDDLENISIFDERNVLIGAKEGFIHFDLGKPFEINEDFRTLIRSVEIKYPIDSTLIIKGELFNELKLNKNSSMKFQFASPYFDGFEDLSFSYRLVGFDKTWSSWSSETSKEYTNLPDGNFQFEVKARNIYENESEVLSSSFKIIPKWYNSSWAYMSYFTLGLLIFGLISFAQDKSHKKERKRLYLSAEEAIKNKDEELSHVSKKSEEEIQNLKNQKLRSEIDHKNNELASATMHLLNKNEFVQGIRKRLETMVKEDNSSKDEMKRILKTIDRNLGDDDSWDQFAFHFDQVHGDFLKSLSSEDIKLTPQETKLAAYLRMSMSSKEIANLMNISVRGVELARYRLRKKLKLERDQNLIEFLLDQ